MRNPVGHEAPGSSGGSLDGAVDGALVARVLRGDSRAFDQLVRRHLRAALAVARSRLGGLEADVEDVVQEAFITALERIDQCRDPERFRSWLLAIVRNHAHNHRERERVRTAAPLEDVRDPVDRAADPSHRVERAELARELEGAMADLTESQRRVFVLHDMEGWSHGEIAEELEISRGASRFQLHAARKKLRNRLTAFPSSWSR